MCPFTHEMCLHVAELDFMGTNQKTSTGANDKNVSHLWANSGKLVVKGTGGAEWMWNKVLLAKTWILNWVFLDVQRMGKQAVGLWRHECGIKRLWHFSNLCLQWSSQHAITTASPPYPSSVLWARLLHLLYVSGLPLRIKLTAEHLLSILWTTVAWSSGEEVHK